MDIKCPKCRYRFAIPISPGMTELQCNCPRCGIPFTYTIDNDPKASELPSPYTVELNTTDTKDHVTRVPYGDMRPEEGEHRSDTSDDEPVLSSDGDDKRSAISPVDGDTPSSSYRRQSVLHSTQQSNSGCGCVKLLFIAATMLMLVITLVVYQCGDRSYTADDVTLGQTNSHNKERSEADGVAPAFNRHAKSEKPPKWIQGTWYVKTDYGEIYLIIYGRKIAETSGGETSYGRFKYQNHYLYCNFGDNNIFVYRLVEETKQIDAGKGLLMRKIK